MKDRGYILHLPPHIKCLFGILDRSRDKYLLDQNERSQFNFTLGNTVILILFEDYEDPSFNLRECLNKWFNEYQDILRDKNESPK